MSQLDLVIKMNLSAWESQNKNMNRLLAKLDDDTLAKPTAEKRNTGIYLLGHLAAVSDGMLTLLGLGEKLYPELENIFLKNPEGAIQEKPDLKQLREYWTRISDTLTEHFSKMSAADWLTKHTAVSEEDFAKEPHRNKLNVLISRTNHLSYHLGQLVYL